MSAENPIDQPGHPVTFSVDGEAVTSEKRVLTPVQIMDLAGVDPSNHYLVRVEGRHQDSYQDRPNEELTVHDGETFVTVSTGPTPVS